MAPSTAEAVQGMTTRTRRDEFATEFQKRGMVKHVKVCVRCDSFDGPAERSHFLCALTEEDFFHYGKRDLSLPPPTSISPPTKALFSQTWKPEVKKSEAIGLRKTWKQGMKKMATSATNPLLREYLLFTPSGICRRK